MAARTPIRQASQLALATDQDRCSAAPARSTRSPVHPQRLSSPRAARGGARSAARVGLKETAGRPQRAEQLRIIEGTELRPRIQRLDERYFALVHIPDPGDRLLIQQHISELLAGSFAEAAQRLIGVEGTCEQVGPKSSQRSRSAQVRLGQELHSRSVEGDGDGFGRLDNGARLAERPAPALARAVSVP